MDETKLDIMSPLKSRKVGIQLIRKATESEPRNTKDLQRLLFAHAEMSLKTSQKLIYEMAYLNYIIEIEPEIYASEKWVQENKKKEKP